MVKILKQYQVITPVPAKGMRISVAPSAHATWLNDYEYYDQLGRDPLQERLIWGISDPAERMEKLKEVLEEYPKTRHRRLILLKAARRGDEDIVRAIVETGIQVHPDVEACLKEEEEKKKREEAGEAKEEENEDTDSLPDKDDATVCPVHAAATFGKLGVLKIFIESGIDVDIVDEMGRTLLIAAAAGNQLENVRYLLGQGANPTKRCNGGEVAKEYLANLAGADALEMMAGYGNVEVCTEESEGARLV